MEFGHRAQQQALESGNAIGGDARDARERKLERDRSGGGERSPGAPERGILFGLAGDDARMRRPLRGPLGKHGNEMRQGREHNVERAMLRRGLSERFAEDASEALDLVTPAARQRHHERRTSAPPTHVNGGWPQVAQMLQKWMAHIDAGRAAEVAMDLGLERQQREDEIDR